MKLKSISISNLLSFKFEADPSRCQIILFHENLNILVGPNGTGKSNFLEVINYLFQHLLFKPCNVEDDRIDQFKNDADYLQLIKNTVSVAGHINKFHLPKNRSTPSANSRIVVNLSFNSDDIENILFVYKNASSINAFIEKYSMLPVRFHANFDVKQIHALKDLRIQFDRDNSDFVWQSPGQSSFNKFLKDYTEYFEVLQSLILIANRYDETKWPFLKNTFVILGCYRNYDHFPRTCKIDGGEQQSLKDINKKAREQSMREVANGDPVIFSKVMRLLAYKFMRLSYKYGNETAQKKIREDELFAKIDSLVQRPPLCMTLMLNQPNQNKSEFELHFIGIGDSRPIAINELSAGQKNLLHLIFSLCGNDTSNGLIIIDEPELHLHPQSQGYFLDIITGISREMNVQFLIVTHSPVFIRPSNIQHVFRFYLEEGFTRIINPEIGQTEQQLIKIINFSNSTKIFFSSKIVLVEGESDEYFFRFLFSEILEKKSHLQSIEVLNINGKGNYRVWKSFLDKFKIDSYFICDWDNVAEFGILTEDEISINTGALKNKSILFDEKLKGKNSTDRNKLVEVIEKVATDPSKENLHLLVQLKNYLAKKSLPFKDIRAHIKEVNPILVERINQDIGKLWKEGIFILCQGELEDYLQIEKGIGPLVRFLSADYSNWKSAQPDFCVEIEKIVDEIALR